MLNNINLPKLPHGYRWRLCNKYNPVLHLEAHVAFGLYNSISSKVLDKSLDDDDEIRADIENAAKIIEAKMQGMLYPKRNKKYSKYEGVSN